MTCRLFSFFVIMKYFKLLWSISTLVNVFLIAVWLVIVRNNEYLSAILYHKFHNCTRLKTKFSRNKLLIWSKYHLLFEIKSRLTRNSTNQIREMFSTQKKSTTIQMLRWFVFSAVQTLFNNSLINKMIHFFWLILSVI